MALARLPRSFSKLDSAMNIPIWTVFTAWLVGTAAFSVPWVSRLPSTSGLTSGQRLYKISIKDSFGTDRKAAAQTHKQSEYSPGYTLGAWPYYMTVADARLFETGYGSIL